MITRFGSGGRWAETDGCSRGGAVRDARPAATRPAGAGLPHPDMLVEVEVEAAV